MLAGHRPSWRLVIFFLPTQLATECSPEIIQRLPGLKVTKQVRETMTLTKAELADLLFEKVGFNKREAKDMVESFYEEVRVALQNGDGVKLSGFGNFQLRDKPQRPGRNPKTGEEIPITARRVVTFHASQKLKAMVEKNQDGKRNAE
jgi:integration host factor subunit alpha